MAESRLFFFKASGKFSRQNLTASTKNVRHKKNITLSAFFFIDMSKLSIFTREFETSWSFFVLCTCKSSLRLTLCHAIRMQHIFICIFCLFKTSHIINFSLTSSAWSLRGDIGSGFILCIDLALRARSVLSRSQSDIFPVMTALSVNKKLEIEDYNRKIAEENVLHLFHVPVFRLFTLHLIFRIVPYLHCSIRHAWVIQQLWKND